MQKDKTLWIIGADSDIALCFIKKYASSFGRLILGCRKPQKLESELKDELPAEAHIKYIDLTDKSSIDAFISSSPVPFGVIFFAGHFECAQGEEINTDENIFRTAEVNYLGPVIFMERISSIMRKENEGFIALLSSAGDIRGKFSNRFYVSSKKAVSTYMEGLMQKNEAHSVKTMIFKLGHTDTKMLEKIVPYRRPVFVASPEKTADFIFSTVRKNKSVTKYYRPVWKILAKVYSLLPSFIYNRTKI